MNYLPKTRSRNARKRAIFIVLGVFILGLIIFYFLGGLIITAVSPLWKSENAFATRLSAAGEFFSSRETLTKENEKLKDRIASLETEISNYSSLSTEESRILATFNRGGLSPGIAASVLVRPPQTPYDFIIVDAGAEDGVLIGMEVSLAEGPILGTVHEVFGSTSKVRLFSSPGQKSPAVFERSGLSVELEGTGGGNFKIEVPRETPVEVGDRVLSADVFSRLVAVVEEIKVEQTDSFKEVLASSPASLFNMRFVLLRP